MESKQALNYMLNLSIVVVATQFLLTCVGSTIQPAATLKFVVVPGFEDKTGNSDASGNNNARSPECSTLTHINCLLLSFTLTFIVCIVYVAICQLF